MKRSKIIVLLSMLLVAATMLCACGASELSFKKIADGSKYKNPTAYTNSQPISSLQNASQQNSSYDGNLLTFTDNTGDYTRHIVYSLKNNAIVYSNTENEITDIYISLGHANEVDFFLVKTTTYVKKNGVIDYSDYEIKTALFDTNSSMPKHSVNYDASYESSLDLLKFGGKIFRINENGISNELPISPLAAIPDIFYATNEYYYAENDGMLLFYTKELKLVSSYKFPGYAEGGNAFLVLEEDNKVFAQYVVEADDYGDKYDIISDGEKFDFYTVLIDAEDGSAKELDFEYIIGNAFNLTDEERSYCGFNEEVANICYVCPIVDKHIDDNTRLIATISKKGDISFFEDINGLAVEDIELVNPNIWYAETVAEIEYLINQEGEVIGEVTGATRMNDKFILAGGKVFNYQLSELYDYMGRGYTVERVFSTSIIFRDTAGEFYLYQGQGDPQRITNSEDHKSYYSTLGNHCYVIRDASNSSDIRFRIYNESGMELQTLGYENNFSLDCVAEGENGLLIKVTGWDSTRYRTTYDYYVIR